MRNIGLYIAIFGIASIVLSFMDMNLKILMWVDNWGETTGWIIRIGLVLVGGIIALIGHSRQSNNTTES